MSRKLITELVPQPKNVLIHGPSGAGKSLVVFSAHLDERTSPLLLLDFEGGSSQYRDTANSAGEILGYEKIETWDQFSRIYDQLVKPDPDTIEQFYKNGDIKHGLIDKTKPAPAGCIYDGVQYHSVAIDSISEVHMFALLHLLDDGADSRKNNPDLIQQGDYGVALVQMRRLLRAFRNLPIYSFFTALSKTNIVPGEGLVTQPSMSGILAEEICAMFDFCNYLSVQDKKTNVDGKIKIESKRILTLQNAPNVRAKSRTKFRQRIPNEIEIPDITVSEKNPMTVLLDTLDL